MIALNLPLFPNPQKNVYSTKAKIVNIRPIEYKKNFQEPVPGITYKGYFIPEFLPEER